MKGPLTKLVKKTLGTKMIFSIHSGTIDEEKVKKAFSVSKKKTP